MVDVFLASAAPLARDSGCPPNRVNPNLCLPKRAINGGLLACRPADADTAALLRRLVAAGDVTRFERVDPSLRDIYLRAIGAAA